MFPSTSTMCFPEGAKHLHLLFDFASPIQSPIALTLVAKPKSRKRGPKKHKSPPACLLHNVFAVSWRHPSLELTNSNRFGHSALHQRDARSSLFDNYTGDKSRTASQSPGRFQNSSSGSHAYPAGPSGSFNGGVNGTYRSATPNKKYVETPVQMSSPS